MPRIPTAWLSLLLAFSLTPRLVAQQDGTRLLDALRTGSEPEREQAALELAETAPPAALPALIRALREDDSSEVRQAAAFALGAYQPPAPETVAALMEALAGRDPRLKTAVATTLSRLGREAEAVVRALLGALAAEDPRTRQSAVIVLERIGAPAAEVPALVPAVTERLEKDPDERVRRFAVAVLAAVGERAGAAVPALVGAVRSDASERVRQYSAEALRSVGAAAEEAVPVLTAALADPDWGVRVAAARALGEYGPGAAAARTALEKAAKEDPEEPVREAAKTALKTIRKAPAAPTPGPGP